jgi:hypothetical protein
MTEEQKEQAIALTKTFAQAAKEHDPLVVMSVLEAAMTGEIYRQDELVGQLFEEMMDNFKKEASVLLGLSMLMKAVKKAKENPSAVCPTCNQTPEEYLIASATCNDPFHTTATTSASA